MKVVLLVFFPTDVIRIYRIAVECGLNTLEVVPNLKLPLYLTETDGNCVAHKTIHEENTLFNSDNLEIRNSTHTKLFTRMTMVLLEFLVSQT